MLFAKSGFGLIPAGGAGGVPLIQSQSGGPTATAPDVAGHTANNVCTSDKFLIYINGTWRVRSLNNDDCASVIPSETADYVAKQGEPIFVGPFQIDPKASGGQITTIDDPSAVGTGWGEWFHQAALSIAQAKINKKDAGWWKYTLPLPSLLPRVVGATQDYYDNGTPSGAPMSSYPAVSSCLAKYPSDTALYTTWLAKAQQAYANNQPAPQGPTLASASDPVCAPFMAWAIPFPPVPAEMASGGHALHPNKAWFSTDARGNRVTNVTYDGDDNVYSFYNYAQWIASLAPAALTDGSAAAFPHAQWLKPSNTTEFNRNQNVPPVARFTYPFDAGTQPSGFYDAGGWGLWAQLSLAGQRTSSVVPPEGDWDTGLDAPSHYVMQIGMAMMPQEGLWDDILDAIEWIPTSIGDGLFDLAGWLSGAVCGMNPQQIAQLTAKIPPGYAQAVALGALGVRLAAQCGESVDCTATPNAPSCQKPVPATTPWWQRWYVVIPALGLLGYGIFKLVNKKPTHRLAQ